MRQPMNRYRGLRRSGAVLGVLAVALVARALGPELIRYIRIRRM
jgi:hypothetical protein